MASIRLRVLVLLALLGSLGCKSDDTSNNPQGMPDNLVASDFIDHGDNILWEGRIKGTSITFDSTGKQVGIEEGESDNKATIGATILVDGFSVRPLYVYDADGGVSGDAPIGYIGIINGNLSLVTFTEHDVVTVLPKQIKVGEWTPSTKIPVEAKSEFKILEYYPKFTNGVGRTYSDVIKTIASYSDSTMNHSGKDFYQRNDIDLEIYYAKGVGPVEIVVKKYDERSYDASKSNAKYRRLASGTASRTNE
jgi:hypothetical protein